MKKKIEMILDKLQIPIDLSGYKYWIDVIEIYEKNNDLNMAEIYERVGKKYSSSESRVERSLRHSYSKSKKNIQQYFEVDYKITNKRLLYLILREVNK